MYKLGKVINDMEDEIIYTISNASMNLFPQNSRAKFSNALPKVITTKYANISSLYVSLENLIMENSIVQYKGEINTPDICWSIKDKNYPFLLKESNFESAYTLTKLMNREIKIASKYFISQKYMNEG